MSLLRSPAMEVLESTDSAQATRGPFRRASSWPRAFASLVALLVCACGSAPSGHAPSPAIATDAAPPPPPPSEASSSVDIVMPALAARFPNFVEAIALASTPNDDTGLLGRNRTWGELYSVRFQLGAGAALRAWVALDRPGEAARAFRAIEVALASQRDSGELRNDVPASLGTPALVDRVSGSAFFLGDACLGLAALDRAPRAEGVASLARREDAKRRVVRATSWLAGFRDSLLQADRAAPNRLLFDARTFHACAALGGEPSSKTLGDTFVDAALATQRADGVFVEGGGADTSYQAVAVAVGVSFFNLRGDERMKDALVAGARWLSGRVCGDGRVDSSGNTRTCGGGESFLGEPKKLPAVDVFGALAGAGVLAAEEALLGAGDRVARFATASSVRDGCFEGCP